MAGDGRAGNSRTDKSWSRSKHTCVLAGVVMVSRGEEGTATGQGGGVRHAARDAGSEARGE